MATQSQTAKTAKNHVGDTSVQIIAGKSNSQGQTRRLTLREQMILEGRSAAEIADMEAAYLEMGDSIDRPKTTPQPLTQDDLERIAKNLWILNKHKGINY